MTESWEKFPFGPWKETAVVPGAAPSEQMRTRLGLPRTLRPVEAAGVVQRPIFDPSVQHHTRAMRLSEPHFTDPDIAARWYAARRDALDCVLAAVAGSPWSRHLVLRGSVLLRAWFGTAAREPGDVDFLVVPQDWQLGSERTQEMFDDLGARAQAAALDSGIRIRADAAADDDIWTYSRVPGRRLVLPWTSVTPGVPPGSVQLDFVFNEALPEPPVLTEVPRIGRPGPSADLLTASPQLSLAWKIQWLTTDSYPEGKDLYDAVLLAEHCRLPAELLRAVTSDELFDAVLRLPNWVSVIEWAEFGKDYPDLAEELDAFVWRLLVALAPTFASEMSALYEPLAQRLWRWIEQAREALTTGGLPALKTALADYSVSTVELLVLTRESLGSSCSLREAADIVAELPEWRGTRSKLRGRVDPHVIAAAMTAGAGAGDASAGE
ncbi:nucleotidyl transferase AbiEii/AbiGii toxin family protein [Nocardia sp. NPDC050710]|uniref:nucleotidyl transferase AbiEii/AbiGii toxin family protein n=1 Tax=Nocardia sp. NPDC050710 TaxID=3157220 RepID=UPI0033CFC722